MLQSSINRLNGSLIALNRTLAWEIRTSCVLFHENVTFHGIDMSYGNTTCGKLCFSTKEFSKLRAKYGVVPHMYIDRCE